MENHSRRVGVRATTMDRRVKIKEIRGGERREREGSGCNVQLDGIIVEAGV